MLLYHYGFSNMSTTSPNMSLVIPTAGVDVGPTYALMINSDLNLLDAHDHTPGKGAQITPAGFNINTDLSFNNYSATTLAGLVLSAQLSAPSTVGTIYQIGPELYFADGVGNQVQITQNGGVAGAPGSISNLVPPASASYVAISSTFAWKSTASLAANMDFGAAVMRNISPNSTFALTLQPPPGLATNYTITLPTLPVSTKIVQMTSAGVLSPILDVDNVTIEISSNNLQVKDGGITAPKLAPDSVILSKVEGSVRQIQKQIFNSSGTFTTPATSSTSTVYKVTCVGPGGGGARWTQMAGGGGAGATSIAYVTGLAPNTVCGVVVGTGGPGGAANTNPGAQGSGATEFVVGVTTYCNAQPGEGGTGNGTLAQGGAGGDPTVGTGDIKAGGGDGDAPNSAGSGNSQYGNGGNSSFGGGGRGACVNAGRSGGSAGRAPGAGGGGGSAAAGGAGANGIAIIEWVL